MSGMSLMSLEPCPVSCLPPRRPRGGVGTAVCAGSSRVYVATLTVTLTGCTQIHTLDTHLPTCNTRQLHTATVQDAQDAQGLFRGAVRGFSPPPSSLLWRESER